MKKNRQTDRHAEINGWGKHLGFEKTEAHIVLRDIISGSYISSRRGTSRPLFKA